MLHTLLSRRRREEARVDAFLHAILLSEGYTLDPHWELQPVRTDTVAFPRILLLGTPL